MLRLLLLWLDMLTFLLAVCVVFNTPLLLILLASRKRVNPTLGRTLLAAGFGAAVAFQIWRMEWFDVWRHGFPGFTYLLTAFAPYMAAFGLVGWLAGGMVVPQRTRQV